MTFGEAYRCVTLARDGGADSFWFSYYV